MARRRRLSLGHKTNVLTYSGDLWHRTVYEVAEEYPEVEVDYYHVDAMCLHLINSPERFDVIVTDNLFGDIVTDIGAAVQGGMGLAASGNLNPELTYPSLFEPVHGSAPDIMGRGWPTRRRRCCRRPCACPISASVKRPKRSRTPPPRCCRRWKPWPDRRWETPPRVWETG